MAVTAPTTVDFDPVTRVAGGLALHTVIDSSAGRVTDAATAATLFRGYELLLEGRDARDAIFISSRACGACGGAHATAAALALDMACDVGPPPFAIVARNVLSAIEDLYDMPTALFLRAGPDYSEQAVRDTNPELWERAQGAPAAGHALHGYARIADIMTALTRLTGELYREALVMSRKAREGYVIAGGKYPHPQTLTPGGISSTIDVTDLNLAHLRVVPFFDYGRKVAAVWDDLADFLLAAEPGFADVGATPANFIDFGRWDDPFAYDARWETASEWGERRWATPGVVVDGRLRTTDLREIDRGIEESVDHSFYDEWRGAGETASAEFASSHPINKATLPAPANIDWDGRYSWSTAPRWNGYPLEAGVPARMCVTALAGRQPHTRFVEATGSGLRFTVPQGEMRSTEIEWRVPSSWNALERHRARAYGLVHAALVAYENVLMGYDLNRRGGPDAGVFEPYDIPREATIGVGYWGSGRGAISHHVLVDRKILAGYQIVGGSTWTMSPRDGAGNPGPCEQGVIGSALVSTQNPQRCIDVLRAIRGFDPCMGCAAH